MAPATRRNIHPRTIRTVLSFPVSLKTLKECPSRHLYDDIRNVLLPKHGVEGRHVLSQNLLILLLELAALLFEFLSHGDLLRRWRKIRYFRLVGKVTDLAG